MATTNKTAVKKNSQLPKELGVRVAQSSIYDYDYFLFDKNKDLTFPYSVKTYEEMTKDAILAAALSAVQTIAVRVPRFIEAYDETPTHKKRAEFVEQCLGIEKDNNDMTHSFDDFLREVLSLNTFGFASHEKVFRIRRGKYGSKFDDGKVGIKRLPLRPQSTIEGFEYDDEGREMTGVVQRQSTARTTALRKKALSSGVKFNGTITIPRGSILHFTTGSGDGKAEGVSPLSYVNSTWRDYQRYKDLEGIAASKNLNGLPVIWMPSEYMTDDPLDPLGKVYQELRDGVSKIAIGEQSSLVLPSDREDMTGQGGKLFDFTLMSASSSNITAITAIIERLKKEMLLCLFASEISESTDSTKTSMLNMLVENRIKEVFTVLNNDLIPHLFRLNGWDATKTPSIKYGKLRDIPFESFAKAMQQVKATKLIPVTPENINYISEELGLPYRVDSSISPEDLDTLLGVEKEDESGAGEGLATEGEGTSKTPSEKDESANNVYNK
jgi:hypothetical protein